MLPSLPRMLEYVHVKVFSSDVNVQPLVALFLHRSGCRQKYKYARACVCVRERTLVGIVVK